ncbi:MAG: sulfite exporter TauE/SafE family protein [Hyphomonadaceae bacterium]|nr:sulfite exporter TauE/SafE family protein [Hyphomonadaceae bacterium]
MAEDLPLILAAFLLGGLVKGATGLGLPAVATGLLSLAMPPLQAAALIVVPALVTNVWQTATGPALQTLLRRLWPLLVGICLGTWSGAALLSGVDARPATAALGVAIMLYALASALPFSRGDLPRRWEQRIGPVVGAISGLIAAVTGVFVIPLVPFVQALGLDRDGLVQALGISFMTCTVALALALAATGDFSVSVGLASLFALAPALVGMFVGTWIRNVISPIAFRRVFLAGFFMLGAYLVAQFVF